MPPKKPQLPKGLKDRLARARSKRPRVPKSPKRPKLPTPPPVPDTSALAGKAADRARAQADRAAASRDQLVARMRERQNALKGRPHRPPTEQPSRRRWVYLALFLLLLLLLLLLPRCSCTPIDSAPVVPVPVPVVDIPEPEPEPAPVPLSGRVQTQKRPAFVAPPPPPLVWLDRFRMQVAARSPRLSKCFEGQATPGTLKWTTSVEPGSGRTSGHTLEPTLASAELTGDERACVLGVLTEPAYTLPAPEEGDPTTPSRVSIVLEF